MNNYAYNYENSYDELMHYGVKGMRWGVDNMLIQIGRKYVNG